jgi:hypothetical protein
MTVRSITQDRQTAADGTVVMLEEIFDELEQWSARNVRWNSIEMLGAYPAPRLSRTIALPA